MSPFMEVEWVSAGHVLQDEALADEIADFAMNLLDGYDPAVSSTLRPEWERDERRILPWEPWAVEGDRRLRGVRCSHPMSRVRRLVFR